MHELSETCVVTPQTPPFDLSSFINGALKMGCEVDFMSKFSSLPAASNKLLLQRSSTLPNTDARKRRRGEVANPANTLDGLVARRANDGREPFQKRCINEQEAIEGPNDEIESKRMEKDPDVSTRTCSCGYVGKWVSEMIRHKRVHTDERPYKCRYCSRTSKWKADLIRHIAKTHGIRVVSKYSRSKTFDPAITDMPTREEEEKPRIFSCDSDRTETEGQRSTSSIEMNSSAIRRPEPVTPNNSPLSYKCAQCLFEQDGLSLMLNHLRSIHNVYPYECRCGASFENIDIALNHSNSQSTCTSNDLVVNITPIYNKKKTKGSINTLPISPSGSRSDCSPDSGVQADLEDSDLEATKLCGFCPFKANSEESLKQHRAGHEVQKGVINYKCAFCNWYSKKKCVIEDHMRIHSPHPQQYMPIVERNLITPVVFAGIDNVTNSLAPSTTTQVTDMQSHLLNPNTLSFTSALLALQCRLQPSYIATMNSLLSIAPSAFSSVHLPLLHHCDRCDARFRDMQTLTKHQRFHGASLTNTCPICNYSCNLAANLLKHVQTHHYNNVATIGESLAEEEEIKEELVDVEV